MNSIRDAENIKDALYYFSILEIHKFEKNVLKIPNKPFSKKFILTFVNKVFNLFCFHFS